MGSSKKQTVGYWYRPVFHIGMCQGPIDAFLRVRGGDVDAWIGQVNASGTVHVDAPEIWGGEGSEGGMQGAIDVMFGEDDQEPNAYFQGAIGADPSGHRGIAAILWKGGRYGAMNPYPKPISLMVRRIIMGWHQDDCWYPETAPVWIGMSGSVAIYFALDGSGSMNGGRMTNMRIAINATLDFLLQAATHDGVRVDVMVTCWGDDPDTRISIMRRNVGQIDVDEIKEWVNTMPGRPPEGFWTYFPAGVIDLGPFYAGAQSNASRIGFFLTDGEPSSSGGTMTPTQIAQAARAYVDGVAGLRMYGTNIDATNTTYTAMVDNVSNGNILVVSGGNPSEITNRILAALSTNIAMNPAHIIYDSLTDPRMQGEPRELINDDSFRAAADKLFSEGFGLCTMFDPDQETVEQFRQRICDVIGAQCSRSTVDGKWYLDLVRGDYDIESLPILTDDDIIEFQDDPSVLDDAVNQVAIKWFDPLTKQDRITAPVHSLGAIQALGMIVAETSDYREIPIESLANRIAARDLINKSTPLWRKTMKTNRRPWSWRLGTYFRVQAPKHGVSDMVCLVGDIDKGTLRSGAISLVAIQDVFSMPAASYVVGQPAEPPPDRAPVPVEHQVAFEAPYVELAATLPAGELQALNDDAGFLQVAGARPGVGNTYQLHVSPDGGGYERAGNFDWCPTAVVVESGTRDPEERSFTLSGASLLERVDVGSAALWGEEIVRVDAIDADTGAVEFGRGCADTMPHEHAAGARVWFYDAWASSDNVERVASETIHAKLLTRTGTSMLPLEAAVALPVVFSQRQARPYPPHQLKVNDEFAPLLVSMGFTVTWVHRDRVQQADLLVDSAAASIGPESGTTYTMRVYLDDVLVATIDEVDDDEIEFEGYGGDGSMRLEVSSVRDDLESWQAATVEFPYMGALQLSGTLPPGLVDVPYSASLVASGGTPPYSWSIGAGAPAEWGIDPDTGEITGTATVADTYDFDVIVEDSNEEQAISPQSAKVIGDPLWANVMALLRLNGDATDEKGNALDPSGSPEWGTGKFGQGMVLTTGDSGLREPSSTSVFDLPGDFTAELWANATPGGPGAVLLNRFHSVSSGYGWQIYMEPTGKLSMYHYGTSGGSYPISRVGPDIRDGNWHHIALTRSGSTVRLFLDGVLVGTGTSSQDYTSPVSVLSIGYQAQGGGRYPFRGVIDEVRITKGVARYTSSFTPPDEPFPGGT